MAEIFCEVVAYLLRQTTRKILWHVAAVVRAGAGLVVLDGDTAVRICAGRVRGEIQI